MLSPTLRALGFEYGSKDMHAIKAIVLAAVSGLLLMSTFRLRRSTHELQALERNFRSLFESNPDGVCLMSVDGRFVTANRSFETVLGYTVDELKHLPNHPFVDESNQKQVMSRFARAAFGQEQRYETTVKNRIGLTLQVDLTYLPMYRDAKVVGVYIIVKDLTPLIQTKKDLDLSQQKLSSFLQDTTDAIFMLNTNEIVLAVNPAFETMYGWQKEDVVGRVLPDELYGSGDNREMVMRAVLDGRSISGLETSHRTRNRTLLPVTITASPIIDESGKVIAIAVVSRDISLQKRLTQELREVERRFESIFRNAGDAISLVDSDGNVLLVNPAWESLFGWKFVDVQGRRSPTLTGSLNFHRLMGGEVFMSEERTKKTKDGCDVTVSVTATPLYNDSGNVEGAVFIYKDITEKKKAGEILLRAEKLSLAGELAASVAHEIRNPLASIQGFLFWPSPDGRKLT